MRLLRVFLVLGFLFLFGQRDKNDHANNQGASQSVPARYDRSQPNGACDNGRYRLDCVKQAANHGADALHALHEEQVCNDRAQNGGSQRTQDYRSVELGHNGPGAECDGDNRARNGHGQGGYGKAAELLKQAHGQKHVGGHADSGEDAP